MTSVCIAQLMLEANKILGQCLPVAPVPGPGQHTENSAPHSCSLRSLAVYAHVTAAMEERHKTLVARKRSVAGAAELRGCIKRSWRHCRSTPPKEKGGSNSGSSYHGRGGTQAQLKCITAACL